MFNGSDSHPSAAEIELNIIILNSKEYDCCSTSTLYRL